RVPYTRPMHTLTFRAGAGARQRIFEDGFAPALIGSLIGASGGAKWLALSQLDRVVASEILPSLRGPVFTLGSSIGAWRFACYAQAQPSAAIDRFEEAYLAQRYSERPSTGEITARSLEILDHVLGTEGASEILAHPHLRTNIMAVRSRPLCASDWPPVLAPALGLAALSNLVSRRSLGAFFERALFHDARDPTPFDAARGFSLQRIALDSHNLRLAIAATGAIPLVLEGFRDIPGAEPGVYRDGGIIDYHLDMPQGARDGRLALYLHFIDHLIPGWFDKALPYRKASATHLHNTILISPSREFVATLPGGKIPDRKDFSRYDGPERERRWREVIERCRALADEFHEVLATGTLAQRLQPLG
ncbi:MAG: patatin-like phospholipase family protein, partial [Pseudomonadota bacterium]